MTKVIISGATSMIGLALIEECIKDNIQILALCRANSAKLSLIPKHKLVKILACDLEEMKTVALPNDFKYNVFFHLGWAYTDKKNRDDPQFQAKNIDYTLDAVKFAKAAGCKKFIGAGSQAEYGRVEGKIKPNQAPNPDISYGAAKYCAGILSRIMCGKLGIEHNWVRIFSVYGKNDNSETLVSYLISRLLAGKSCDLTACEQQWDYLNVEDCAKALLLIARLGKNNEVYNIGGGKAQKLKEYVEVIKRLANSNSTINYGAIPYSDKQVMHLEADIGNLTKDTGFVPSITFEQGISQIIQTLR